MKYIMYLRATSIALLFALNSSFAGDEKVQTLTFPLCVNIDRQMTDTGVPLSIPYISLPQDFSKWLSSVLNNDDKVMLGFLEAVRKENGDELKKYLRSDADFEISDFSLVARELKKSYYIEEGTFFPVGKIPTTTGAGYVFFRNNKAGSNPNFFILIVKTKPADGTMVQPTDEDGMFDVLQNSINSLTLQSLGSHITDMQPSQLSLATLDLFKFVASSEVLAEVQGSIAHAANNNLKESFTALSQARVDAAVAKLSDDNKKQYVEKYIQSARSISKVMVFGPVVVTIQERNSYYPLFYYYRDKATGKLLATNFLQDQPFSRLIQKAVFLK